MASSVADTRAQLNQISGHLMALLAQTSTSHQESATPLLRAALDAVDSYDEDVPLPLQTLLHYLGELSQVLTEDKAQSALAQTRQTCIDLLIDMFVRNQQKIDTLSDGPHKLKEQYYSAFLQNKNQLAENFHQHKELKPAGRLGNILQFLDFREVLRRADYVNSLHAEAVKFYRQSQVADTSFNHAHLLQLMELENMQRLIHRTLMTEPSFDTGMLPASSRSYQFFMREQVGRHHGIVIGNLSIKNNTYEASKEWLEHINKVMQQPMQTYQLINEMDKFTAKEQSRFDNMPPKVSSTVLKDKNATSNEFRQVKTYDDKFTTEFLKMLDNAYPPSAIVQFSDKNGNSHAIAVAKDERGIWMHDASRYCVYFPNKVLGSNEATLNFSAFFEDYHHRNYPELTQVALVHLAEPKRDVQLERKRTKGYQATEREQPLLLGPGRPGRDLGKQAALQAETTIKPAPLKPGRGPKPTI